MKYDKIIVNIGSYGRYQKFFYFLTFMTSVPNGLITLMFVFIHFLPDYRCSIPLVENLTMPEQKHLRNYTIPWVKNNFDEWVQSTCTRYNLSDFQIERLIHSVQSNVSTFNMTGNYSVIKCDRGWKYDLEAGFMSAVTEFNMVCDDSWRAPLAVSLYMIGMGIGTFSGILADRFGRRPVFLWSTFLQFVAVGVSGFAWNYVSYVISMFATGLLGLVNFLVAFVMATESMDHSHRNYMAIGPFFAFSVGYVLSPLIGYLLQNWRWYMWANALIGVFYIPYYWVMPESPRWLITRGRIDDAKKVLRMIAKVNGKSVDIEEMFKDGVELETPPKGKDNKESNFFYVFLHKSLTIRFLSIYFGWFVTSMVYYALSLNTSSLNGNRFLNCLFSAFAEFPGYTLSCFTVKWFGTPRTLFAFMTTAGFTCTIVPLLQAGGYDIAATVSAMIGKGAISVCFYAAYILASEISPTLVRNSSSGLASGCARIGGFVAPYLLFAGMKVHPAIPFFVMGCLAFISSVLALLFVPETKGVPMPETRQEAIENQRIYGFRFWKLPRSQRRKNAKKIIEEETKEMLPQQNDQV